jgi:hypothetical protein
MRKERNPLTMHAAARQKQNIKRSKACAESAQLERITSKLPSALKKAEKRVPEMLTNYQQRRIELGKLLYKIQTRLAPLNLYSRYLKTRNIPRRTAYDLINTVKQPEKKARRATKEICMSEIRTARFATIKHQFRAYFASISNEPNFAETLGECLAEIVQTYGFDVRLEARGERGAA